MTRALLTAAVLVLAPPPPAAHGIAVRHREGLVHGFLSLETLSGQTIADGDLIQNVRGAIVTSRLVFHFRDGSLHDDTATFSQAGRFTLLHEHLVQKGPSFPRPLDMTVDPARATVRYRDDHGTDKVDTERLTPGLPLANGLLPVLLKNVGVNEAVPDASLVVATPRPRVVTLKVEAAGRDAFTTGGVRREAIDYVVKIDLGGVAGIVAPLVGKQPPDSHVWILAGEAPAFVKAEEPLFAGGPVWRIRLIDPVWPK